jgi:hypothetical protein
MDFKYEMKIDHPQSSTIWAEIEILDIIKESNEFLIKYSKNEKYIKIIKLNQKS